MKVLGWILAIVAIGIAVVVGVMLATGKKLSGIIPVGTKKDAAQAPSDPTGTLGVGQQGAIPSGDAASPGATAGGKRANLEIPPIRLPGGRIPTANQPAANANPLQHLLDTAMQSATDALSKEAAQAIA